MFSLTTENDGSSGNLCKLIYKDPTVEIFVEPHSLFGVVLHANSLQWGKGVYKHYLWVMDEVASALRAKGLHTVFVISDNEKLTRFSYMLGFTHTGEYALDKDDNKADVLEYKL